MKNCPAVRKASVLTGCRLATGVGCAHPAAKLALPDCSQCFSNATACLSDSKPNVSSQPEDPPKQQLMSVLPLSLMQGRNDLPNRASRAAQEPEARGDGDVNVAWPGCNARQHRRLLYDGRDARAGNPIQDLGFLRVQCRAQTEKNSVASPGFCCTRPGTELSAFGLKRKRGRRVQRECCRRRWQCGLSLVWIRPESADPRITRWAIVRCSSVAPVEQQHSSVQRGGQRRRSLLWIRIRRRRYMLDKVRRE